MSTHGRSPSLLKNGRMSYSYSHRQADDCLMDEFASLWNGRRSGLMQGYRVAALRDEHSDPPPLSPSGGARANTSGVRSPYGCVGFYRVGANIVKI